MFPEVKPRVTSRFEGNKINCFPRDQSYSDVVQGVRTKKTKNSKIFYNNGFRIVGD